MAPALLVLLMALLCATWHAQPATAQRMDTLEGATFKSTESSPQLLALRTSGSAAAAQAGVSDAMAASSKDRWWEDSADDDTKCEATYARLPRVVGLTSHATARACADSCRCGAPALHLPRRWQHACATAWLSSVLQQTHAEKRPTSASGNPACMHAQDHAGVQRLAVVHRRGRLPGRGRRPAVAAFLPAAAPGHAAANAARRRHAARARGAGHVQSHRRLPVR